MNTSPNVNSELSFVQGIMHDAIDVMRLFPEDFSKKNSNRPEIETSSMLLADSVNKILADKKMQVWLRQLMESFPKGFQPVFIQCSSIIAQILDSFSGDSLPTLMELSFRDEKAFMLLNSLMQLRSERKASGDKQEGFELSIQNELYRRQVAAALPFRQLLTTLLGRDALLWLKAASKDGYGKMQPHEFSRSGWIDIWAIKNQIDIEKEFMEIPPQYDHLSKIVVALSWTLAALASFIPPDIFLGEALPTITSLRDGRLTITNAQYTVGSFHPESMLKLVQILAEGLVNALLSAADLMWVDVSLAKLY